MKTKLLKISKYFLILSAILFSVKSSFAATLVLQKIGNLDKVTVYFVVVHCPSPVRSGTAEPSSEVSIKIGEVTGTANSDASEPWSLLQTWSQGS